MAAMARYFRQQNELRKTDIGFANSTLALDISSIGIINGWVDLLIQTPFYPLFAYNNTYGIRSISQVQQLNALNVFSAPNGCKAKTLACRTQAIGLDPSGNGMSSTVNGLCSEAAAVCQADVVAPYLSSGRSIYDISQRSIDPFPNLFYLDYLNRAEVQDAIGTTINYTQASKAVSVAFNTTGDYAKDGALQDLSDALAAGTRVALIYGDRDYICNWLGGEAVSFALAGSSGFAYKGWYNAGYAPIVTNISYIGGVVREYGNLSFSRIYDAGHLVPAYQPETAFTVFSRIIQGTGIGMGNKVDLSSFASSGEPNSTHKNTAPVPNDPKCFIRAVNATCDVDHKNLLANGAGVIINGIQYRVESDWISPPTSIASIAGYPGTAPRTLFSTTPDPISSTGATSVVGGKDPTLTTTRALTGVYTATAVPSIVSTTTTNGAVALRALKLESVWTRSIRLIPWTAFGLLTIPLLA